MEFYRDSCTELGLAFEDFKPAFSTPQARQSVMSHFRLARELGVRGFPSVIARIEERIHQMSVGYRKFNAIQTQLEKLIA